MNSKLSDWWHGGCWLSGKTWVQLECSNKNPKGSPARSAKGYEAAWGLTQGDYKGSADSTVHAHQGKEWPSQTELQPDPTTLQWHPHAIWASQQALFPPLLGTTQQYLSDDPLHFYPYHNVLHNPFYSILSLFINLMKHKHLLWTCRLIL